MLENNKQTVFNTQMTASWHVVVKLLIVNKMSEVGYQNKVLF